MTQILVIPFSNVHVKQVFSIMKTLWSDARNRMSTELLNAKILKRNVKVSTKLLLEIGLFLKQQGPPKSMNNKVGIHEHF